MDDRGSATAGAGGGAGTVQIQQSRRLPDFLQSVNLKYVKLGYHYLISNLFTLCFVPLIIVTLIEASQMDLGDLRQLWLHLQYNLVSVIICSSFLVVGLTVYIMTRPRPVYLVDYSCYRAPDNLKAPFDRFMTHSELTGDFDDSSLEFQRKILERSGLGEETYVPEAMHFIPPRPSMAAAREEAEQLKAITEKLPTEDSENEIMKSLHARAEDFLNMTNETTSETSSSLRTSLEHEHRHTNHLSHEGRDTSPHSDKPSVSRTREDETQPSSEDGSKSHRSLAMKAEKGKELIEQFEPGVYVTLNQLQNGTRIFKR